MDFIQDDIREALEGRCRRGEEVRIEVVWDPMWTKARIRAEARRAHAGAGNRRMSRSGETVWEVFARKEYEEPLHHVGTVTEDDEELAVVSRAGDLRRAAMDRDGHGAQAGDPEVIRA